MKKSIVISIAVISAIVLLGYSLYVLLIVKDKEVESTSNADTVQIFNPAV